MKIAYFTTSPSHKYFLPHGVTHFSLLLLFLLVLLLLVRQLVTGLFMTHFQILDVSAIVLANLCVCYIMTNQNEAAEELMRKVEKEEERESYEDTDKKLFHLCIINLVIGLVYYCYFS